MTKTQQKDKQTDIFCTSEADQWFERNRDYCIGKQTTDDVIYQRIKGVCYDSMDGVSVLEAGCSNGYRLNWLKNDGATVRGFDPSKAAIHDGQQRYRMGDNMLEVSDSKTFFTQNTDKFDLIIFGHSLYLVSPQDIPVIVCGAIDALNEGGFILIFDFDTVPQRQPYHHHEGLESYKAQYDSFFTWLPLMRLVHKEVMEHGGQMSMGNPKEDCALSIIRKISQDHAFPEIKGDIVI